MVDFGAKLVEVRKAKGLTQNEVAEKCKITVRTIQRIESGKVQPRAFTIKVISEALEFDFFKTLEAKDKATDHQDLKLNKKTIFWYLKDLFNFKTNAMKKVSILTLFCLIISLTLFAFKTETNEHSLNEDIPNPNKKSIPGFCKTNSLIRLEFTNKLTIENLISIKENLKTKEIFIQYNKLEFDKNGKLLSIDYNVDCNDGYKGGFYVRDIRNTDKKYGFYRDYAKGSKSPFVAGFLKKIIVIDAGHGGKDHGGISHEHSEKDIVLSMAKKLKGLYNSGDTEIYLTRNSDEFISLWDRADMINALNPELMISLHIAGHNDKNAKGFECYINHGDNNEESNKLANKIILHQNILKNRGLKRAGFVVLRNVSCPAVLINMGFLSNPEDRKILTSEEGQLKIIKGIIKAIQ